MPVTKFASNWGGKIFPDFFQTVRLRDDDKYFLHDVHDITLDGVNMGEAKIVALKTIRLDGIRDHISLPTSGMSAARFVGWLKSNYADAVKGGLKDSTEMVIVIYQWQKRNYAAHAGYMASFMEQRLIDYRQAISND